LRIISEGETDETLAKARREQWAALSDNARVQVSIMIPFDPLVQPTMMMMLMIVLDQFYWPSPGAPKEASPSAFTPTSPPDPQEPPSPFCLVLFFPDKVDHLELRGDPKRRTVHTPMITTDGGTEDGMRETCLGFSAGAYQVWNSMSVNP